MAFQDLEIRLVVTPPAALSSSNTPDDNLADIKTALEGAGFTVHNDGVVCNVVASGSSEATPVRPGMA
jgi:hypothetical protein